MAKKMNADDRHKPRIMVGLPAAYAEQIDILVAQSPGTNRTDFVREAVQSFLERKGLWPPQNKE